MAGMVIRPYRKTDLEACYALDQVCFSQDIAYSRAELRYFLSRSKAFAIIAEEAGHAHVSGFLIANEDRATRADGKTAHIVTLDVEPEARGAGVATAMMAAAERHYRELGFRVLALEVAVDNEPAIRFYRKHGFVAGGILAGYYNGRIDALSMSKRLQRD